MTFQELSNVVFNLEHQLWSKADSALPVKCSAIRQSSKNKEGQDKSEKISSEMYVSDPDSISETHSIKTFCWSNGWYRIRFVLLLTINQKFWRVLPNGFRYWQFRSDIKMASLCDAKKFKWLSACIKYSLLLIVMSCCTKHQLNLVVKLTMPLRLVWISLRRQ